MTPLLSRHTLFGLGTSLALSGAVGCSSDSMTKDCLIPLGDPAVETVPVEDTGFAVDGGIEDTAVKTPQTLDWQVPGALFKETEDPLALVPETPPVALECRDDTGNVPAPVTVVEPAAKSIGLNCTPVSVFVPAPDGQTGETSLMWICQGGSAQSGLTPQTADAMQKLIEDAVKGQGQAGVTQIPPKLFSWSSWIITGAAGAGVFFGTRLIRKKRNEILDDSEKSERTKQGVKWLANGLQGALIAGGVIVGLQVFGIDMTILGAGLGLTAGALVVTLKEFLNNGIGSLIIFATNVFEPLKGEIKKHVQYGNYRGDIGSTNFQHFRLDGVDEYGDPFTHLIPAGEVIKTPLSLYTGHPEIVSQLKVGQYCGIRNAQTGKAKAGKIVKITDLAIFIEIWDDASGTKAVDFIHANDVNPNTFWFGDEPPALPRGLTKGSRVRVHGDHGNIDGVITDYDTRNIVLEVADAATHDTYSLIYPRRKLLEHGFGILPPDGLKQRAKKQAE